jgi:hypothetical protein
VDGVPLVEARRLGLRLPRDELRPDDAVVDDGAASVSTP